MGVPGERKKETVLFVCSFNSVRSQIAEGLLRHCSGDRFTVDSAGIAPAGLNPRSVKVMAEIGIDISQQRSRSIREFEGREFDYLVILCPHAKTAVPALPVAGNVLFREFASPDELGMDEEATMAGFRRLRDGIRAWLFKIFPSVPEKNPE